MGSSRLKRSNFYQRLTWMRQHPELWDWDHDQIVKLMKKEGLVAPSTYVHDIRIGNLIALAAQAETTKPKPFSALSLSNEQLYYDALRTISQFDRIEYLRKNSVKMYGLNSDEAIEAAYENAISMAKAAIRGKKRPEQ